LFADLFRLLGEAALLDDDAAYRQFAKGGRLRALTWNGKRSTMA